MPAQSDKREEPENLLPFFLLAKPCLSSLLQRVMALRETGWMSMPPVMIICFLWKNLLTFLH